MKNFAQIFHRADPVIDLTTRAFSMAPATIDEKQRSVRATIATSNPTTVYDWMRGEVIDEVLVMEGMEAPDQVPMLDNHARYSVQNQLGSVRNIAVENGVAVATLIFDEEDPDAERAWGKVRRKHLRDVSCGYRVSEAVDIPAGKSGIVNGKSYTAGARTLRVSTRWQPREVSLTPIGADQFSKIRSERGGRPRQNNPLIGGKAMNWLTQLLGRLGLRSDASEDQTRAYFAALSDERRSELATAVGLEAGADAAAIETALAAMQEGQRAQVIEKFGIPAQRAATTPEPVPMSAPTPTPAGQRTPEQIASDAVRSERERVNAIRAAAEGVPAEVVERAISQGLTVDAARAEFLTAIRAQRTPASPGSPAIHIREGITAEALSASILLRSSLDPERAMRARNPLATDSTRQHDMQILEAGSRFRNMPLYDVLRHALTLEGRQIPVDRDEMIRAAFGTATLANIFTSSVYAVVLGSYAEAPDTTRGWVREGNLPNFMTQDRLTLGKSGALQKLPRGQEASHATISDGKESYKLARYANQFAIDEQDIIDDRLDCLTIIPMEMGQAARRLRPDLVYSVLKANANMADGYALFDNTNHANATDTAFGDDGAGLKAAIAAMLKQKEEGVNLNLTPAYLILGVALKFTAEALLKARDLLIAGTAGSVTTKPSYNVLADQGLTLVVDARLDNGVTDPSSGTAYAGATTTYFLASNPISGRGIEVGYLNGQQSPQLRSYTLDKGRWGIGWDIKLDIGAKALGYKGLVRGNS